MKKVMLNKQGKTKAHKITKVRIPVPYRKPGNVISYLKISFDVYKTGSRYEAFPNVSPLQSRLLDLPECIPFQLLNNQPMNRKYEYIVADIVAQLQRKQAHASGQQAV